MSDTHSEDEVLVQLTRGQVLGDPGTALVADLYRKLREAGLPWWSGEALRELWPAEVRMAWFVDRADIRQRVTHTLTGLAPKAARHQTAQVQGALIDAVIDSGDITVDAFEQAFDPAEIAVHAGAEVWRAFMQRMPWTVRSPEHKAVVLWLVQALVADHPAEEAARGPILTPLVVRSAIDGRAWHEHIPVDVRVAIDAARLRAEWEGRTFDARQELDIVTIPRLVEHLPLVELRSVCEMAERTLRLGAEVVELAHRQHTEPKRAQRRATA